MIISKSKKLIFIHIPKNAGSFVKKYLQQIHDVNRHFYGVKKIKEKVIDISHINLNELKTIFPNDYDSSYSSFCIIRKDIVQRFKSAYVEYTNHIKYNFFREPLSVNELLKIFTYDMISLDHLYIHFRPQTLYTHNDDDEQVVTYLIDIENIVDGLNCLLKDKNINIKINSNVTKINEKADKFDFQLEDFEIEQILKLYERDLRLLL
jgi:hypothetical protein